MALSAAPILLVRLREKMAPHTHKKQYSPMHVHLVSTRAGGMAFAPFEFDMETMSGNLVRWTDEVEHTLKHPNVQSTPCKSGRGDVASLRVRFGQVCGLQE